MDTGHFVIIDESNNTTGTFKDRRSAYIVEKALREGVKKLCLITSGNAGYSLALAAKPHGIVVDCIVDTDINPNIRKRLEEVCNRVISIDLSEKILKPEDVISLVREKEDEPILEVTNGYSIAYEPLVEIILPQEPDYIFVPVGSGEAYVGIHNGLKRHGMKTKLVGVGVLANPSFADKLATSWTPYADKLMEIEAEGHMLVRLTEKEVKDGYELYRERMNCEPSSSVVWKGIEKLTDRLDLLNKKVVVLNSGKGLF